MFFYEAHVYRARASWRRARRTHRAARPPRPPRPRPDTFVSAAVSLRPLYVYSLACGCKPHLPPAISKSYASSQCAFFTWFTGADPLVVVCGNLCAKFLCGVLAAPRTPCVKRVFLCTKYFIRLAACLHRHLSLSLSKNGCETCTPKLLCVRFAPPRRRRN